MSRRPSSMKSTEGLARLILEYGDLRQKEGENRAAGRASARPGSVAEVASEKYAAIVRALVRPA